MSTIKKYLSLIKFSHTIFAMPFALIGFFIGVRSWHSIQSSRASLSFLAQVSIYFKENFRVFILVILCMIFARSAAMAFNRLLDYKFDAKNPRTAIREIPSGVIKTGNALLFTIANCILFIICCWFINILCFYLSFVALAVILFYSYTKRFTSLCHLILGLGLSLAPIGAYLAVTGRFDILPVLFSLAVLFWVSGFDIIYALQDAEFDQNNKLHSIPATLGKKNALRVAKLLHFLSALCVIYAGQYGSWGYIYWVAVAIFAALLIYQHTLVKPMDLSKVNMAFFTTNGIASVIFCIFVLLDLFINGQ
ncbi:MAG: UbiA family prenyltransferase [Chitinophagaceae bacterium]|nr:UbiA family prenyltransferase [Chitinophagaceae bacterium]